MSKSEKTSSVPDGLAKPRTCPIICLWLRRAGTGHKVSCKSSTWLLFSARGIARWFTAFIQLTIRNAKQGQFKQNVLASENFPRQVSTFCSGPHLLRLMICYFVLKPNISSVLQGRCHPNDGAVVCRTLRIEITTVIHIYQI
jgi:hypothetical protein